MGIVFQGVLHATTTIPTDLVNYGCTEGFTLLHDSNCSAYFECSNNEYIVRYCPANLHFNAELGVCDYPSSANCPWESFNNDSMSTTSLPTTTESDLTNGPNNNICPLDEPGYNIFLPHPNCNFYFMCYWGELIEMQCQDGKHWNAEKNYCDWKVYANCVEGAATYPPNESDTSEVTTNVPQNWLTTSAPPNECPSLNNEIQAVHLPHPNCEYFYLCNWGIPVEMKCPNNLHFNQELDICTNQKDANCVEGAAPQQPNSAL